MSDDGVSRRMENTAMVRSMSYAENFLFVRAADPLTGKVVEVPCLAYLKQLYPPRSSPGGVSSAPAPSDPMESPRELKSVPSGARGAGCSCSQWRRANLLNYVFTRGHNVGASTN